MLPYLLLGFLLGAALLGSLGWWQHRRTRRALAALAAQVQDFDLTTYDQRFGEVTGSTETVPLVHSLNQLLDHRQAFYASQQRFITQAAHQLRTPLTSMRGQLEVTLIKPRPVEQHEQTGRSVLQDVTRFTNLFDDLLLLSQLPGTRLQLRPVALDEVLYQAAAQLKARHPAYQVHIELALELADLAGPLTIPGDADLLVQACRQLLENGCRFSPDHQVRVTLSLAGPHARLQFADHGSGIAAHELPHIFEPFFVGETTRGVQGHGLGLPLARQIAQRHGGTVEVSPGPAAVVEMRLPRD